MPKIEIDGATYEVSEGRNVLEAALDHRLDLPYFCYHPGMGAVGSCRLCAVKQYRDADDDRGRVVMSCMTPAGDGMRVSIHDREATEFRRAVTEWLMTNHPHDCPVCDEGGECHLQDMTVMTGHARRRYRGTKRTFSNQYLGPFIHHEMNRCIQCYRCTRFYNDCAGGEDFGVFGSRNRTYFGRYEESALESPFSGNLVEVCPTGVFTDKTYRRHYARKWDLESAPSICGQCGLGCNTIPAAMNGTLRRVTSRFSGSVNGYWLCDRGRFGYEYVSGPERLRAPLVRGEPATGDGSIVNAVAEAVCAVSSASRAGSLAGVGSPTASVETNWMLRRLVGPQKFCSGVASAETDLVRPMLDAAREGRIRLAALQEVHQADVVLVLGCDPTHEAPLLDLEIVRAQRAGAIVHVASLAAGRLDKFAATRVRLSPPGLVELAGAVASGLAGKTVAGTAATIAASLATARRPVIVTGTRIRHRGVVEGALRVAEALSGPAGAPADLVLAVGEANTVGATLVDDGSGMAVEDLLESIENGEIDTLVVSENDLFARSEDSRRVEDALRRLRALVVFDSRATRTGKAATWLIPISTMHESNGTVVNHEGRAQRFFQVLRPHTDVTATWKLLRDLAIEGQVDQSAGRLRSVEAVLSDLGRSNAVFAGTDGIAPPPGFRAAGRKISRVSSRQAGRNARPNLVDVRAFPKPADDPETPFTYSMEGYDGPPPAALLPRYQLPGWNSTEAINQFQIEVGGPLHGGDPGRRLIDTPEGSGDRGSRSGNVGPDLVRADPDDGRDEAVRGEAVPLKDDVWLCAADEIFGSEPTSRLSPAIAERASASYLRLDPGTAARLGLVDTRRFDLSFHLGRGVRRARLTVRVDDGVAPGVALVPAGYGETLWLQESVPVHVQVDGETKS